MVISAEKRDPMAAPAPAPTRSSFPSFPILKAWGQRKLLRCASVDRNGHPIRSPISHTQSPSPPATTVRLRSKKKRERPRFSISLSMAEIDEDIYALTGSRARRRPRKRPRPIQKQIDALFPGSWLREITAESYRVPE